MAERRSAVSMGLVLAGVALLGGFSVEAPLACLCGLVFGLGLLGLSRRAWLVSVLVFVVCGVRARGATDAFEGARLELRREVGRPGRCHGLFVVASSPTLRTDLGSLPERKLVTVWRGRTEHLSCEAAELSRSLEVRFAGGPPDLRRGDRVSVVAELGIVELYRNPELPSPLPGVARRRAVLSGSALVVDVEGRSEELLGWVDGVRARVRGRILATFAPSIAPLARALVLGESDLLESEADAFAESGLSHLLAVSGTHLVIAIGTVGALVRGLLARIPPVARRYDTRRLVALATALLALFYAEFSGGSGSAYRAAFMLTLVSGFRVFGRPLGGFDALAGSVLLGVLVDPLYPHDLSFLLSVAATSGLLVLGQPLTKFCSRGVFEGGALGHVVGSLCATLSASLFCGPIIALLSERMTLVALVANVVAAPFGEVFALPACLLHSVVEPFPALERGLAYVGGGALEVVRRVALWSAGSTFGRFVVPFPDAFVLVAFGLTLLHVRTLFVETTSRFRRIFGTAFVLGLWVAFLGIPTDSPARSFRLTLLDVGQGDAYALHFPTGEFGLLDGGGSATGIPDPAERVLLPYLRKSGRKSVDLMILSHAHPDHYQGLLGVARAMPVRELWHPEGAAEPFGPYKELLELVRQAGGRVLGPKELCEKKVSGEGFGGRRRVFGVDVEILAPCPGPEGMGLNDESLVLRVTAGGVRYLLTGDAEKEGEARLLRTAKAQLAADVLKAGHHGSDTSSTPEFLDAVRPRRALISCGVRNRYDHPRRTVLDEFERRGIAVHRADLDGGASFDARLLAEERRGVR